MGLLALQWAHAFIHRTLTCHCLSGNFIQRQSAWPLLAYAGRTCSMVASWLGDGDNDAMFSIQVRELLDSDKVTEFASKLNIDEETAVLVA